MKGFCKIHTSYEIVLNGQCRQCVRDNVEKKNKNKPSIAKKHKTITSRWRRRAGA
jgi:hypothetical protein